MESKRTINGPICSCCGIRASELGYHKGTKSYYKKLCKTCKRYPGLGDKARQTHCSVCLKTLHPVCLDVDHIITAKPKNNTYKNLQIICANCHRLKSLMCHDYSTFKKDK